MNLVPSGKSYFRFNEAGFSRDWRAGISPEYSIRSIDPILLDFLDDNTEVLEYIRFAWKTEEAFFKSGFGFCAVSGNSCAGLCIAVFGTSDGQEAGIKIFQGHQRRGLGLALASAFVEECLNKQLVPVWSCFSDNAASINLAVRLGFEPTESHPIYFASV